MPNRFSQSDVGCYADSAHGHQHARRVLCDLVAKAGRINQERIELVAALQGEMTDDGWEEDAALAVINDELCGPEVCFAFVDGDLMCLPVENDSE